MKQLHGPELGYNNLLDFSAALGLLLEFEEPAAVVIKHTNPCGAALGRTVGEAMARAKASDPVSIYGGIVGVNRTLDMAVVQALAGIFVEILFAPAFAPDALEELRRTKKKCRVFEVPMRPGGLPGRLRRVPQRPRRPARAVDRPRRPRPGRAQDGDAAGADRGRARALRFAWRVAKHAKSNAIVLATARAGDRRGRGPDEPRWTRRGWPSCARARSASRPRAPCAPPTRSFRSATGSTWWPRRARPR